MIESEDFRSWLKESTNYCDDVVKDNISRMKRADSILAWNGDETYLFYLEREPRFTTLSVSVRSQLRKAVKLYTAYQNALSEKKNG